MTVLECASPLLNGARLIAGTHSLRLLEVELYVYHSGTWADPYVHCDPRQLKPATWYVHQMGGSHKQGTFKGLDLTAGDGQHAKRTGLYDSALDLRQHKDIAFIYGYLNAEHIAMSIQD